MAPEDDDKDQTSSVLKQRKSADEAVRNAEAERRRRELEEQERQRREREANER
jgi:hypothetical protein